MHYLMTIKLFLSQTDSRPMYLQIMTQIKQKVMVEDWQSGFHLPSIREMASATGVSVITVKRAYSELEREGVIFTQQGRGSFIAQTDEMRSNLQFLELDEKLKQAVDAARELGLSDDETKERMNQVLLNTHGK
jgi:GntR family transcriptional regulator